MKISVIMVDGGFRENIYSLEFFSDQNFPDDQYEVIWVEYFRKANEKVKSLKNIKVIELNNEGVYHSSYCFNAGISAAKGEIIVIPDADQIVGKSFLDRVYENHSKINNLVCYGFRYDEIKKDELESFEFSELAAKCKLKNPSNYGGCLTVRREFLLKINGYEQHEVFGSGFHANGLDVYTRFKNLGLPVMWDKELILYHPWHDSTLSSAKEYERQKKLISWRANRLQYMALFGVNDAENVYDMYRDEVDKVINSAVSKETSGVKSIMKKIFKIILNRKSWD